MTEADLYQAYRVIAIISAVLAVLTIVFLPGDWAIKLLVGVLFSTWAGVVVALVITAVYLGNASQNR